MGDSKACFLCPQPHIPPLLPTYTVPLLQDMLASGPNGAVLAQSFNQRDKLLSSESSIARRIHGWSWQAVSVLSDPRV